MSSGSAAGDRSTVHAPASAVLFHFKRQILQWQRAFSDWRIGLASYRIAPEFSAWSHVLTEHRSPLWSDETVAERGLQLGKVQNLRVAVRKLHGIALPANALFSFWRQIGPATRSRGYAPGRELREGCLIPAVGGGLCQLSNALYAAAVDSGAEIVERHAHSRIVPGSAAAIGRDATVAYNYVDLRFRFAVAVRLECLLTSDELVVRFVAASPGVQNPNPARKRRMIHLLEPAPTGSCVSCGQAGCFRHDRARPLAKVTEETAYLVDRYTPELSLYVESVRRPHDTLFVPLRGDRFHVARYAWPTGGFGSVNSVPLQVALCALQVRLRRSPTGAIIRNAHLTQMDRLATAYARKLRPEQTHLVISQDVLPALWRNGDLGGRTFDVLMTRLPMDVLQRRLDDASRRCSESATLRDFRAPAHVARAESEALATASRIITPHPELARMFGDRAVCLPWKSPSMKQHPDRTRTGPMKLVFPGPTVARKGCYAVRDIVRAFDIEVLLLGKTLENREFWAGSAVRYVAPGDDSWMQENVVVVQPSLWEDSPRVLLRALAAGIPAVAAPGCGLGDREGVVTVEFGDSCGLSVALSPFVGPIPERGHRLTEAKALLASNP